VCTIPGTDSSGRVVSTVGLAVSMTPSGARQLSDEGILVRDEERGSTYLVWHGRRHLVQQSRIVVAALFGAVTPTMAGTAWLNSLPAGLDITPIQVNNRGTSSSAVKGRKVGDLLVTETGSGPQAYLVFDDGLAPITPLQQAILAAEHQVDPIQVNVSDATSAPRSSRLPSQTGDAPPPSTPPTLVTPGGNDQLCAVTGEAKSTPTISVGGTVDGLSSAAPTPSTSKDGATLADRVLVPAGRVVIARVLAAPTAETGTYYVITDLGIRYAASSAGTLPLLGYRPELAVDVPANLITRLPAGPTLDPVAAMQPAPINASSR
jgi:hypothetical protein